MMWYEKILKALILKVYQDYRDEAQLYVEEVLYQIELLADEDDSEPVPAELLLGLIGAMYKKYYALKEDSVLLADFSLTLLGLTLIYSKASSEIRVIWTKDFKYIWDNSGITQFFDSKKKLFPQIFDLEIQTLTLLNNSLKIDWDYLLEIFSLKEFAHLKNDIYDDFEYLLESDDGGVFTEFLNKVKQIPEPQPDLGSKAVDSELRQVLDDTSIYSGINKALFFQPMVSGMGELENVEFLELYPLALYPWTLM